MFRSHNRITIQNNPRLGSLLQSTRQLLKDGGTPQVITLADETLKEIKEDTLPAVKAAHDTDQNLLDTEYKRFTDISEKYDETKAELKGLRDTDRVASSEHKQCRSEEVPVWEAYKSCEVERQALWADYAVKHTAFKNGGLCEAGFGNDQDSVDEDAYEVLVGKGQRALEVLKQHEVKKKECITKKLTYDAKRVKCDGDKVHLEDLVCKSELFYTTANQNMNDRWDEVNAAYADIRSSVESNAEQRVQEMNALVEIRCLLDTIHKRGGKACEESEEGNVTDIIKQCQQEGEDEVDAVKIHAEDPPARPEEAPAKPYPCTSSFLEQEYSGAYLAQLEELPDCSPCEQFTPVEPPKPANVGPFTFLDVCVSAKDGQPGTLAVPAGACINEIVFNWEYGHLTCNKRKSHYDSHFGCDDSIGLVIAEKDQKEVVWPLEDQVEGMKDLDHKAHWYTQKDVGAKSPVLRQKLKKGAAPYKVQGDLALWYNEDLFGHTERDNDGTACYTVDVLTEPAGVTC